MLPSTQTASRNANATVQCPVKPGPYSVSQMVELPEEIPKAKFAVLVRGFTVEDEDMLCLDLFVDFVSDICLSQTY